MTEIRTITDPSEIAKFTGEPLHPLTPEERELALKALLSRGGFPDIAKYNLALQGKGDPKSIEQAQKEKVQSLKDQLGL